MSDFRMPDSFYEPPDEQVCEDGCVIEDEHDRCYTREDWLADEADRRYDEMKDRRGERD